MRLESGNHRQDNLRSLEIRRHLPNRRRESKRRSESKFANADKRRNNVLGMKSTAMPNASQADAGAVRFRTVKTGHNANAGIRQGRDNSPKYRG